MNQLLKQCPAAHCLFFILPAAKHFFTFTALHKLSPFLPSGLILLLGKRANFRLGKLLWAQQLYSYTCIYIFNHHPTMPNHDNNLFQKSMLLKTKKISTSSFFHLHNSSPFNSRKSAPAYTMLLSKVSNKLHECCCSFLICPHEI